ncbi:MAG: NAD-dependent dehydratase, partial [Stenotrophomonas sp.]
MRVLLAGATGLVGAQVLQRLLAEPRCSGVIAPTRRALAQADAKLLNPVLDFAELATVAQGWQVDAVICALGSTMKQAGS